MILNPVLQRLPGVYRQSHEVGIHTIPRGKCCETFYLHNLPNTTSYGALSDRLKESQVCCLEPKWTIMDLGGLNQHLITLAHTSTLASAASATDRDLVQLCKTQIEYLAPLRASPLTGASVCLSLSESQYDSCLQARRCKKPKLQSVECRSNLPTQGLHR